MPTPATSYTDDTTSATSYTDDTTTSDAGDLVLAEGGDLLAEGTMLLAEGTSTVDATTPDGTLSTTYTDD